MGNDNIILTQRYHSPCGELVLGDFKGQLCLCDWVESKHRDAVDGRLKRLLRAETREQSTPLLQEAARQLDQYFRRERRSFSLPLLPVGTDFQRSVWQLLAEVPYGSTVSYAEMARLLGKPRSFRAVANANGANAISIFVPCHRVLGSNHALTGYAGGIDAKRFLLELEKE